MFLIMESNKHKNILVTGGLGFIGWNFIRHLYNQDEIEIESIVNIDAMDYSAINTFPKNSDRYTFYKGKMGEISKTVLEKHDIDLVFNFAAHTHVDNSLIDVVPFLENNIVEVGKLITNCKTYWDKRGKNGLFVQISTDEVFGSLEDQGPLSLPFDEYSLLHPNNPYSSSKASAELLIRSFIHSYNFPAIITNCSNNYGPGQHSEKLIPKIIKNALNGENIPIYGDGLQKRDWIYVEDHCEGILAATKNYKIGSSYLFGTNKSVTNLEISNLILNRLDFLYPKNSSYKNLITFVEDRLGHDRNYCIDYTRTLVETGWYPKTSLLEGVDKTVSWYLNKFL
jgi:dTDP-glucose 4,6-dehydratase